MNGLPVQSDENRDLYDKTKRREIEQRPIRGHVLVLKLNYDLTNQMASSTFPLVIMRHNF